jgi:arginine decarboxylase
VTRSFPQSQRALSQPPPATEASWTLETASATYSVAAWGKGYFAVNELGHLELSEGKASVDLKLLVDDLTQRGIALPFLIRFPRLLQARIELINGAFERAIDEYGYQGAYCGVYPIKVNQSRKVVEAITRAGRPFHFGLEAGSKPELLAAMALLDDPDALIICNGYKDEVYVETALLASRLRGRVIIVVEKPSELQLIRRVAERMGIEPSLGIRMRLSTRGAGKWRESGGDKAKFGLSANEILTAVEDLAAHGQLHWFQLLHFHLGSQITAIRAIKDALREGVRMYTELVALGCEQLELFDVGGGLGVDYHGSQTTFDSSMNYTVQEYANDVVWLTQQACDAAGIQHPTLVSESGRAVVAHHSVLVVDVIGVTTSSAGEEDPDKPAEAANQMVWDLWEAHQNVCAGNVRESYHDVLEYKDQALQLFNLGHLSLQERARCERLFWATCRRIRTIARELPRLPAELAKLDRLLSDTYFCNFSLFQSLPDAWAIDQLFPIMPIHRLDEPPTRHAVLADITCDSDGKLSAFIAQRDVSPTLPLHPPNGEPYYLAMLLTGAYQEILGGMHNLFGDTHTVNVDLTDDGYTIDEVVYGDSVEDVLRCVDYEPKELINRLQRQVEVAVTEAKMSLQESRQLMQRYRDGMVNYTYLE